MAENNSINIVCPLCNNSTETFYSFKRRLYYQCKNCLGIIMDKKLRPDKTEEKKRYEEHINDVEDENYQNFVSPITNSILQNHNKDESGLDFGAGTGPVISKILIDNNYQIELYDPFFHNHPHLLEKTYGYIACCEVIEHFYNPPKEFTLLKKLLNPDGKLYCMTELYRDGIDFHNWHYKNDQTHVFIYHAKSIEYVKEEFGFSDVSIEGRLIIFSN